MYYETVYDMLVNVNGIYYVCEQARWARSAENSAIENLCIIIIILYSWITFYFYTKASNVQERWGTFRNSNESEENGKITENNSTERLLKNHRKGQSAEEG